MAGIPERLTLEQIEAIELPPAFEGDRFAEPSRDHYYPFQPGTGYDEGKLASYALKNLPSWSRELQRRWFFRGLKDCNESVKYLSVSCTSSIGGL